MSVGNVAIVIGGCLVLAGTMFGVLVPDRPTVSECAKKSDCARCHAGLVPATHTRSFVEFDHGAAVLDHVADCTGCHEDAVCDDCHAETRPQWHTEAFVTPGSGNLERSEHAAVANERKNTCNTCHTKQFQRQCAACHRPDEQWNDVPRRKLPTERDGAK
ncbi:MAG: hypothetical protein HUU55_16825 [Myxococcales bacterium]|nr:hypothetical protein [Myxococcales bacterium]